MDTPSIDNLVDEILDGGEATDEVVEPQTEQVETEQPPVQEVKSDEAEESFTKVDVNALTDNEKKVYKQFQADYTRKRQLEAEKVRKLEKQLEGLKTKSQTPQNPQELSDEDRVRKIVQDEQDSIWDKQAQADYPSLDSRLDENDPVTYDEILDSALRLELTTKLDEYVEEHGSKVGFDYKGVSKSFVEKWDKYIEGLNKAYVKKQTQIAKENADKLKKQAPVVNNAPSVKTGKMSIDSAIESAFDES